MEYFVICLGSFALIAVMMSSRARDLFTRDSWERWFKKNTRSYREYLARAMSQELEKENSCNCPSMSLAYFIEYISVLDIFWVESRILNIAISY